MTRFVFLTLLVLAVCAAGQRLPACTVFTVVRDGRVWFANNEDYIRPGIIWFVPSAKGKLGRVNVGFDTTLAQGSLNEKGLCFDSSALHPMPWKRDLLKRTPSNLIDKIMDECGTVAEAIAYFQKHNCPPLANAQFLFADASGASAVVAWLPDKGLSILHRQRELQVMTNSRLEASGYRCQRFARVEQILSARSDASLETITAALEAIHQRGPGGFTSYSTVYDLPHGKIHLYNLANYRSAVTFDLAAELAKGPRTIRMQELFPEGPTLADIMAGEQRMDYGTRVELPDAVLDRYAGTYRPSEAPEATVRVVRDGNGLKVINPNQTEAFLFPESETSFRITPDRGQVTFRVEDQSVQGLTLHKGRDVYAERVSDP